jgi:hypothetical protein
MSVNFSAENIVAREKLITPQIESNNGTVVVVSDSIFLGSMTATRDVHLSQNLVVDGFITAGNVIPITTLPFTITTPGSYQLTGNATYSGTGTAAIIMGTTPNVNLDLGGYTIDLDGTGLVGISSSGNNVTIGNGTIRNGALSGTITDDFIFYVPSLTNPFATPNPSTIAVRTAGIYLTGSQNVELCNLTIESMLYGIASVNTIGQIYVSNVNTINCGNYIIEPNPNPLSTPTTILQPVGAGLLVAGSSVNPIVPSPVDPTFVGVARDIVIKGCNFSSASARYAVLLVSCMHFEVSCCTASAGRQALTAAPIGSATGLYLTATAIITLTNSQFGNVQNCQTTNGNTGIGMYWSKAITCSGNTVSDVVHNGIEAAFVYDATISNSVAKRAADSESLVYSGRGFLALASQKIVFDSCFASDFTLGSTPTNPAPRSVSASPNGYGFVCQASKSCVFKSCQSIDNMGGFLEDANAAGAEAALFPGGSTVFPVGSLGSNTTSNDWNMFTQNIASNNVNSVTEYAATPLNNYNFNFNLGLNTPWQPTPVSYTALNTAGAWANISGPV